ncbi:MAG: peptide chain release factor N(5)-glutamine methyltransferase [Anaerolineales bacterium]
MITIGQALRQGVEKLSEHSETPNLDVQVLLANILNQSRAWIVSHPEVELTTSELSAWQVNLNSLVNGTPLPYVIGHWEFFGLDFKVSPDTLIPRPETEILVEQAISWLDEDHEPGSRVADIGTGTGCIAISIAKYNSISTIYATDLSLPALKIAIENAQKHCVADRIEFLVGNLLNPLDTKFDLICANLPYIPAHALPNLEIAHHEPLLALNGGHQGMEQIAQLIKVAPLHLNPGGLLLIEIEKTRADLVQSLAKQHFPAAEISLLQDLSHHDRLVKIQQSTYHC